MQYAAHAILFYSRRERYHLSILGSQHTILIPFSPERDTFPSLFWLAKILYGMPDGIPSDL